MVGPASQTDREILGYSRYVVLVAAFFAMFIISPFEYAWSSMSGHLGKIYGWSHEQIGLLFTLFIIFQSVGMLPGGMLRDRFGPRWMTALSGLLMGLGILALALGPSYPLVLVLWCIGSFFAGFIYNNAKGSGGLYGGILSTILIVQHGFTVAIAVAGAMAILAGLIVIPLKYRPPVWKESAPLKSDQAGAFVP